MNVLRKAEKIDRRVFCDDDAELMRFENHTYEDLTDEAEINEELEMKAARSERFQQILHYDTLMTEENEIVADDEPQVEEISSDLTPSSTTMQFQTETDDVYYAFDNVEREAKVVPVSKTKSVIVAYAVIIATLITLIAVNAVALLREKSDVAALLNEVASLEDVSEVLTDEYLTLTDADSIVMQGKANGMTAETQDVKMKLLEMQETSEMSFSGNWFDSFCNYFAQVFD